MGYDVMIRRDGGEPLSLDEWHRFVEGADDLRLQDGLQATNPVSGETMEIGGEFTIWTGHPEAVEVPLMFSKDAVTVSNPDEVVLERMRTIATALEARVQGEEGEFYDEPPKRRGWFRRR